MRGPRQWIFRVTDILAMIGGGTMLLFAVITVINSLARYLFRNPSGLVFDFSIWAFVLMGILPVGYALMVKAHPAMDLLVQRATGKTKRLLNLAAGIIVAIFSAILVWAGSVKAMSAFRTGEVMQDYNIKVYPFWMAATVGLLFLLLASLAQIVGVFSDRQEPATEESKPWEQE